MAISYCGDLVRRHDPDRFLLTLFAPVHVRESLFALYAFNYEIAKTRETVTETQLGLIRLQWWRDAIGAIYDQGDVAAHHVLTPLAAAIKQYSLPREDIENLIYAREFDLEDRRPSTLSGLVSYAEFTNAPLMKLALAIVGEDDPAARDIATAYGLAGLLRAVPHHARQRRCYLPENMMDEAGISLSAFYEGQNVETVQPVAHAVRGEAERLLNTKSESRFVRRHAKLARMYLAQIARAGDNVFDPALKIPPVFKELRLIWG